MSIMLHLHLAAGAAMLGLIWYVQLVHYPLYRAIGEAEFPTYHRRNTRATARVVLPLMLTEALSGAWLWWRSAAGEQGVLWTAVMLLIGLAWGSTLLLQIPIHRALERRLDEGIVNRLLLTNWIRVAAWTGKTVLLVVFM